MPGNDTAQIAKSAAERASDCLAEAYSELLGSGGLTPGDFEARALEIAHGAAARAYGAALGRRDPGLRASLPEGARAHDRRRRTLATRLGDVSFSATRCVDRLGLQFCPLLDELDVPYGARVSPSATSLPAGLASDVSYARAGRTLGRCGGSRVSATTVMRPMRSAGSLCAAEDAEAARDLFVDGVLPGGSEACAELCVEADGTWSDLQGKDREQAARCEVKAVVAYSGKEGRGAKVARVGCARHACVSGAGPFLREAVAAVGARHGLAAPGRVHVGCDGEPWCKSAGDPFPCPSVAHPGPFHVNRAVMSCVDDAGLGWQLVDALWDGGKEEAATMPGAAAAMGLARPGRAEQVVGYLRNNTGLIDVEGPSLGTMESENQHPCGVRMDSFPCAWSRRGASDMARIRSRTHSGRQVPRMGRQASMSAARRRARAARELAALERLAPAGPVVKSEGSGWEPPHASVSALGEAVRFAADVDGGMVAVGIGSQG